MKLKRRILSAGFALLMAVTLLAGAAPSNSFAAVNNGQEKIQVLIGFKDKPGKSEEALVRNMGGTVKHTFHIIPSIAAELPAAALEALSKNPNVAIIEQDVKAYAVGTFEEELNKTWGMVRIGETTAHSQNELGAGVKVAVIDTGIDYNHPELAAVYKGGYDFVNDDTDPMDIDGHGTHVSGTIAAVKDGNGVTGAAPAVELYVLKVLEGTAGGSFSDVIAALDWCVINGIQITNNSYGSASDPGTQVRAAFDNSYASGILHIASAGNEGTVTGKNDTVGYPAYYSSVMAVGACDESDQRASFSSTGSDVEIIAPGVNISSTYLNNSYASAAGTSMASPHVAGVAAQVLAANPSLDNDGVRNILKSTAENLGLPANHQGSGLVRVDLAIAAATGSVLPTPSYDLTVSTDKSTYTLNNKVYIAVTLASQNNTVAGKTVNVSVTNSMGTITALSGITTTSGQVTLSYRLSKSSIPGTYEVKVTLPDDTSGINATTYFNVN